MKASTAIHGFVLGVALICASAAPAHADDFMDAHFDSPIGPADGRVPTAKKIVTVALLTGTVVGFATSFVFLAQANGAEGDRQELLRGGGRIDRGADRAVSDARALWKAQPLA